MTNLASLLPTLDDQYRAIKAITDLQLNGSDESKLEDEKYLDLCSRVQAWSRLMYPRFITQDRPLRTGDGSAMVAIAWKIGFAFLKETYVLNSLCEIHRLTKVQHRPHFQDEHPFLRLLVRIPLLVPHVYRVQR